jgi:hypothetical protein
MNALSRWWSRRCSPRATKHDLHEMEKRLLMKTSELQAALDAQTVIVTETKANVEKVRIEVQALKDSLGDTELPPEASAALERLGAALGELQTGVRAVDDINTDAPPA